MPKLAPVNAARLSLLCVGQDDQRVRRIKQYVLARLREELANAPRGAQAKLAKRLGVSGAHLSNMLSSTPSRQPGEDFRRKVATHWGHSYAELEALALGEEPPASNGKPTNHNDPMPPNLAAAIAEYEWMHELPHEMRVIVREQARLHHTYSRCDLAREEWHRVLSGLEREALAIIAHRSQDADGEDDGARPLPPRKRRTPATTSKS